MRPPKSTITVQPPMGGVNTRSMFQKQPPFTAYRAINWWPIDHKTQRYGIATRPARRTRSWPSGSAGTRVNMLLPINGVSSGKPARSMICAQDGQVYWWDGSAWQAATGAQAASVTNSDVPVFGATLLQQSFIANPSGKPFVFDYDAGTVTTMVETAGTVPDGLRYFAVWQGALWAAGATDTPNVLYASRVGDALDWDFTSPVTDTGGAFFTAGEQEGLLRGPVTAIIPHTADTLIVSTSEGMIALHGHPRAGGIIEDLSDRIVQGQGAWCKGPDDTTYFMANGGVMALSPQPGTRPTFVSKEKLPTELGYQGWNPVAPKVTMAYDSVYNGIHIVQRGASLSNGSAYWLDLNTGGFFEMTFASYPIVMLQDPAYSTFPPYTTLYGGGDGLTHFEDSLEADESVTTDLIIGPIPIAQNLLSKSLVQSMQVSFGSRDNISAATLKIAAGSDAGDTIDRILDGVSQYEISFLSLFSNAGRCFPRVAGNAVALRLQSSGQAIHIVFEQADLAIKPAGSNRGSYTPSVV